MKQILLVAFGMACCLSSQSVSAQPATTASPSMDSLLAAGYEIKSVNFIPAAQAKEIFGPTVSNSNTLITLQKGGAIAVCTLDSSGFATLNDANMASAQACEQRQ